MTKITSDGIVEGRSSAMVSFAWFERRTVYLSLPGNVGRGHSCIYHVGDRRRVLR
jgi:hypothetical protein